MFEFIYFEVREAFLFSGKIPREVLQTKLPTSTSEFVN